MESIALIFFEKFRAPFLICTFVRTYSIKSDRDKVWSWENPENFLVHQVGQSGQSPLFVESCRVNFLDSLRTGPYPYQTLVKQINSFLSKQHNKSRCWWMSKQLIIRNKKNKESWISDADTLLLFLRHT